MHMPHIVVVGKNVHVTLVKPNLNFSCLIPIPSTSSVVRRHSALVSLELLLRGETAMP